MKKLVVINQSAGYADIDVINKASESFEEIALITGYFVKGERDLVDGVTIDSICNYNRTSSLKRMCSWLWGSVQIFFKLLFKYRGWYVLYYTNPPMAKFNALLLSNRFRIMEYDIYPDALRTIGIKETNPIYKLWGKLNKKVFAKADKVLSLSEGMKQELCKYGEADKIKVCPLWSASEDFKPIAKCDNPFIDANRLDGKFVVMYSGNIGYTHSVEILVEVAKVMKADKNVQFLIIGEGKKKVELQKMVLDEKLLNVTFLPYQDFDVLPYSLASADLGVITLDENVAKVSVPSKTFNLLAVGAPLLAIANDETEMYRLISKYQNGRCIPKTEIDKIADYIRELRDDPMMLEAYRNNSLMASKDYTYKNAELYLN